mgnify:CR=1 FL=1
MISDIKISPDNLLPWSNFEDWEGGASTAPTEHTLSGTGATIAQESSIVKAGTYSAKVTRVGNDATLYFDLPSYTDYKGRKMIFACWVYATVASRARLSISDGVGSTNSSYHTGSSSWERLTVTRDIDASATRIRVEMQVNTGNTSAYFDGGMLFEGDADYTDLNAYIEEWTPAKKFRTQTYKITRRDGLKMPNTTIESQTIKLKGNVVDNSLTTARSTFDAIVKGLNSMRYKPNGDREPKNLFLFDDRFIKVFLDDFNNDYQGALKIMKFETRFTAPEPFYQYINKLRKAQAISSSPTSFTVTVNGNAYSKPQIKITAGAGSITTLTIQNLTTGQLFSYTGTIIAGNSLVVDCDLLTVQNNGSDDLTNFSGDLDMFLLPGDNAFKFTGTTGGTVRVDWFDRWF